MKRLLCVVTGSVSMLGIIVGAFYIAGAVWGPLYSNEMEATRNFKIFLGGCVFSVVAGAFVGNVVWKSYFKNA